VRVEFPSIPYVLTLTTPTAQPRQFTEFSALKFGYLKAKLFLDRKKLPPQPPENVTVTVAIVNANPVVANNSVAVSSLKTDPMKLSQSSVIKQADN
jgi:hypothetical protein